jgi:hypothetical protein
MSEVEEEAEKRTGGNGMDEKAREGKGDQTGWLGAWTW